MPSALSLLVVVAATTLPTVAATTLPATHLPRVALLPGHASPSSPGHAAATPSWPRYLFLFRGVHGGMRLDELRSAALTLGVDGERLRVAPATVDAVDGDPQPEIASYGGDVGPDLLQWVALPDAATAAEVAARCSTVRGAYEVWACAEWSPSEAVAPAEADRAADERWQLLADAVQAAGEAAARSEMLTPLGDGSWRVDVASVGRSKPRSLRGKVELMEKLDGLLGPRRTRQTPPPSAGPARRRGLARGAARASAVPCSANTARTPRTPRDRRATAGRAPPLRLVTRQQKRTRRNDSVRRVATAPQ